MTGALFFARVQKKVGKAAGTVENLSKSGKMRNTNEKVKKIMEFQSFGEIGAVRYIESEFGKLFTNEIIITDERIKHIKDRHPEDYELFQKYGKPATNDPDIVIKDGKNENTVFMVKRLDDANLNVVVKVSVDMNHPEYKNSVITSYRIRNKNLNKLERKRNNKILYKKE